MSQRAAGFGKKPIARSGGAAAHLVTDETDVPRSVPLDLVPFIAPFKKRGRVAVRVERLPRFSRLSNGRNNGDGSWSLMSDELEDLQYLLPGNLHEPHTLLIRVMGLDGAAATTLAVHDLAVEAGEGYDSEPNGESDGASPASDVGHLQQKIEAAFMPHPDGSGEFAKLDAGLLGRENRTHHAANERPDPLVAKGAAAPSLLAHPADAQALAHAVAARNKAEEALRTTRDQMSALQAQLAQREVELARAGVAAEQAVLAAQRELTEKLARSQAEWRAEEAARLAAAEAQWQEATAKAMASALTQVDATRDQGRDAERRRLLDQIAALQTQSREQEVALALARAGAEEAREQLRRETEAALLKAEKAWREAEGARLAAAERRWTDRAAGELASLRERCERAEEGLRAARAASPAQVSQAAEQELRGLQERCERAETALRSAQADAAAASHAVEQDLARLRDRCERAEAALKAAQSTATVTSQTSDAEMKRLRERCDRAEEALRVAQATAPSPTDSEKVLRQVQARCAALESALAEREAELERSRAVVGQDRERLQREYEASLAQAKNVWAADEAQRIAAADAKWRETTTKAVAAARSQAEMARRHEYETEIKRLHDQIVELQAVLMERAAVVTAHSVDLGAGIVSTDANNEPRIVLRTDRAWENDENTEKPHRPMGHNIRDAAIVAIVVMAGVFFYPGFSPTIVRTWQSLTGQQTDADTVAPSPAKPAPAPAPVLPTAVAIHAANVRAEPSPSASVVSSLPRDAQVVILSVEGNWSRVRLSPADGSAPVEGWVFTSLLKKTDTTPSP